MKKLLLSLALSTAALPMLADDYEFYVGTEHQGLEVTNFVAVQEGQEFVVTPHYTFPMIECAVYIKATNNTAQQVTCTIDPKQEYDKSDWGADLTPLFQTCIAPACQTGILTADVPANSSTAGDTNDHIGYTVLSFDASAIENIKVDTKWNITVNMGSYTRHFSVHYTSTPGAVGSIDASAAPAQYFNLQGLPVANPVDGELYIVRQGGKTFKTIKR